MAARYISEQTKIELSYVDRHKRALLIRSIQMERVNGRLERSRALSSGHGTCAGSIERQNWRARKIDRSIPICKLFYCMDLKSMAASNIYPKSNIHYRPISSMPFTAVFDIAQYDPMNFNGKYIWKKKKHFFVIST